MTIYYTYCSYETDKGHEGLCYIGSRKCPKGETPKTDSYFGTPKSIKNKEFKDNSNKDKVILGVFESSEEALAHEIYLHNFYNVAVNPRFANQAKQTSTGFSTEGKNRDIETRHKISDSKKGEKHPMYGKNHKSESRRKMSESHKGKKLSPEICEKLKVPKPSTRGENHYCYDHTLYNFKNEELGIVEIQVTRYYLEKKYGLCKTNLASLVKGRAKSTRGWTILP